MKKNVPIRKVVNTSLAFLISVSHTTPAMEANDVQGGSRELRGHEYYDQKLKELEESTKRIHAEVDQALKEFERNMKEYYRRTRGTEPPATVLEVPRRNQAAVKASNGLSAAQPVNPKRQVIQATLRWYIENKESESSYPIDKRDYTQLERREKLESIKTFFSTEMPKNNAKIKKDIKACITKLEGAWNDKGERLYDVHPIKTSEELEDIQQSVQNQDNYDVLDWMKIVGENPGEAELHIPKILISNLPCIANILEEVKALKSKEGQQTRLRDFLEQQEKEAERKRLEAEAEVERKRLEAEAEAERKRLADEAEKLEKEKETLLNGTLRRVRPSFNV